MSARFDRKRLFASLHLLRQRFDHEHLAQTAGSLTFSSLISMVPLLAVALSLFTAFPAFHTMQLTLQREFAHALLPQAIADQVFRTMNEFAAKARSLGAVGIGSLLLMAFTMLLTLDKALNAIWRTARPRPWNQRLLLYWAAITLGPLALGGGLAGSAALMALHRGWLHQITHGDNLLLTLLGWLSLGSALACLYRFVPNTDVRWRDAGAGALLATLAFDLAGRAFAWYIGGGATLTEVYGTLATLPIFLFWLYWCWMVVLLGAVLAATLPLLRNPPLVADDGPGAAWLLALRVVRALEQARSQSDPALTGLALARKLGSDPTRLWSLLQRLEDLGWVGRLAQTGERREERWTLLINPQQVTAAPLLNLTLVDLDTASVLLPRWSAAQQSTALETPLQSLLDQMP